MITEEENDVSDISPKKWIPKQTSENRDNFSKVSSAQQQEFSNENDSHKADDITKETEFKSVKKIIKTYSLENSISPEKADVTESSVLKSQNLKDGGDSEKNTMSHLDKSSNYYETSSFEKKAPEMRVDSQLATVVPDISQVKCGIKKQIMENSDKISNESTGQESNFTLRDIVHKCLKNSNFILPRDNLMLLTDCSLLYDHLIRKGFNKHFNPNVCPQSHISAELMTTNVTQPIQPYDRKKEMRMITEEKNGVLDISLKKCRIKNQTSNNKKNISKVSSVQKSIFYPFHDERHYHKDVTDISSEKGDLQNKVVQISDHSYAQKRIFAKPVATNLPQPLQSETQIGPYYRQHKDQTSYSYSSNIGFSNKKNDTVQQNVLTKNDSYKANELIYDVSNIFPERRGLQNLGLSDNIDDHSYARKRISTKLVTTNLHQPKQSTTLIGPYYRQQEGQPSYSLTSITGFSTIKKERDDMVFNENDSYKADEANYDVFPEKRDLQNQISDKISDKSYSQKSNFSTVNYALPHIASVDKLLDINSMISKDNLLLTTQYGNQIQKQNKSSEDIMSNDISCQPKVTQSWSTTKKEVKLLSDNPSPKQKKNVEDNNNKTIAITKRLTRKRKIQAKQKILKMVIKKANSGYSSYFKKK